MSSETANAPMEIIASVPQPRRLLQVEHSLAGKFVRRWNFFSRYMRARSQWELIQKIQPVIQRFFDHEWMAGSRVRLRFLHGNEEREVRIPWRKGKYLGRFRVMPWREEGCPASWAGPIAVSVMKKGKDGGRPETVRYMSLFIKDGIIHIAQMQGVALIEMPKGLRDWAERFVKGTMEFAKQENFRGVRVARAETLYSYHHPWIRSNIPAEARERELKRIRTNIELHHNETAINLGFVAEEDWFKWQNPEYKAR